MRTAGNTLLTVLVVAVLGSLVAPAEAEERAYISLQSGNVLVLDHAVRGQDQFVAHADEPRSRPVDAAFSAAGLALGVPGIRTRILVPGGWASFSGLLPFWS